MAKLHRLPWQTPIPLPTLRLTPSTVEAPLRIASRISPRLMPSHRQMISGAFVLAMACLWGVKRGFGCASRNAAVFSARYLPSSLAQVSPGVLIPIRLKNPGAGSQWRNRECSRRHPAEDLAVRRRMSGLPAAYSDSETAIPHLSSTPIFPFLLWQRVLQQACVPR